MTRFRAPPLTFCNACHICTCEVDLATGQVRLLRYVVSQDCGQMINPKIVEGQIFGGVAQGIGGVLYEHMVYDGQPAGVDVRGRPGESRRCDVQP